MKTRTYKLHYDMTFPEIEPCDPSSAEAVTFAEAKRQALSHIRAQLTHWRTELAKINAETAAKVDARHGRPLTEVL